MRKWIVLVLAVLPGGAVTAQEQATNYAEIWLGISESDRAWYVAGFQEGLGTGGILIARVSGEISGLPGEVEDSLQGLGTLTASQRSVLQRAGRFWSEINSPLRFGPNVVARIMTEMYQDPANSFIPMVHLLPVALMRLRGVPQSDVNRQLELRRALVAGR